ncbi:MAG: homoserine dehydrogenase [Candidatus Krumholzibacteriota bacterium]|nr:homoserine dehydrogenase [Candidatus Krumholzibacteriota bacterium]
MQKLCFIGFGIVGQGLAEILVKKKEELKKKHDFDFQVVAVSDFIKGAAYNPKGLDLSRLLELAGDNKISEYPGARTGWDALTTIKECNADIVIEVTYTDIKTGQPAYDHFRAALESGKHLVTTNKGPTALFFHELNALAAKKGVKFLYEGTVVAGTPVLNLNSLCLAGNRVDEVRGILNGTTNFILTNMEGGKSYEEALREAQELGYAEADPTADVEGFDALAKVVILAQSLMGAKLGEEDVDRTGITGISLEDVKAAGREGKRWKLIGQVTRDGAGVRASVKPQKVDLTDPLAAVGGATNALTFVTDLLGEVTIVGPGAGKIETGFSLLIDILTINNI